MPIAGKPQGSVVLSCPRYGRVVVAWRERAVKTARRPGSDRTCEAQTKAHRLGDPLGCFGDELWKPVFVTRLQPVE